ncbi:MAG: hypothetical protein ACOC5G_01535 [Acidobacteriota bacterium]
MRIKVIKTRHSKLKLMKDVMILNKNKEYKANIKNSKTEKIKINLFPTICFIFLAKSDPIPDETSKEEIIAEME